MLIIKYKPGKQNVIFVRCHNCSSYCLYTLYMISTNKYKYSVTSVTEYLKISGHIYINGRKSNYFM